MTSAPAYPAPRLLSLGDAAWTVEFGAAIAPELRERVLGFCQALQERQRAGALDGVVEWVPTYRSVTVHFDPQCSDAPALGRDLAALAAASGSLRPSGTRWRIPVCFDPACAPDLAEVAAAKGLSTDEVVRLLAATEFTVYMLGFLPGFPYLGGLPEALEMPRLASPRKVVPARSVAIAGRMCAAYPWESPGGWRLVGRTPVRLFDAANPQRPALLAPGDSVRWLPVDRAGFEQLEREAAAGRLDPDRLRDAEHPA